MAIRKVNVDLKKEIFNLLREVKDSGYCGTSLSGLKEKLSAQNTEFIHEELGVAINNLLLDGRTRITNIHFMVTGGIGDIEITLI